VPQSPNILETEIRQLLHDEGVVLLEMNFSGTSGRTMLRVIGDRMTSALSIDDCVKLSRAIQHLIAEKKLLNIDYRLEVSSPGLDYPLRDQWQFAKNAGRLLKINIQGEKGPREISGRLKTVTSEGITLSESTTEWTLHYSDILSAKVLPELKPPRMESDS
jgi:ribosome maturation factor RimP